jgi:NAD-dependent SIR2 family protein deacetylase
MRCQACDRNLSDNESTRKDSTGKFMDLCNSCYKTIDRDINFQDIIKTPELSDEDYHE